MSEEKARQTEAIVERLVGRLWERNGNAERKEHGADGVVNT